MTADTASVSASRASSAGGTDATGRALPSDGGSRSAVDTDSAGAMSGQEAAGVMANTQPQGSEEQRDGGASADHTEPPAKQVPAKPCPNTAGRLGSVVCSGRIVPSEPSFGSLYGFLGWHELLIFFHPKLPW